MLTDAEMSQDFFLPFRNLTRTESVSTITNVLCYISSGRTNCAMPNIMLLNIYLRQYLYFGICPDLMPEAERDRRFRKEYFLWQKIDSPTPRPSPTMLITPENHGEFSYSSVPFLKWTKRHYCTFIYTIIFPQIYERLGKPMRTDIKEDWLLKELKASQAKSFVTVYIKDKTLFFKDDMIRKLRGLRCPFDITVFEDDRYVFEEQVVIRMYRTIFKHMCHNKKDSMKLWRKTREHFIKPDKFRFTWQKMCSPQYFKIFPKEELQEIAALDGIPSHLFLTKRELCVELAKKFTSLITGKKKVEGQCSNPTTVIGGDDISKIPPEFFYAYTHNGKVFCDDIRDLHKLFKSNGNKHPYDNTRISTFVEKDINRWYQHIVDTTTSMEDFDSAPPMHMSTTSLLSSKGALLLSKLNYPNDLRFFIDADISKVKQFINDLRNENIISRQEEQTLSILQNNEQLKLALIEVLVNKIDQDPHRIAVQGSLEPLSSVAINMSNVYNEIFKPD